MKAIIAFFAIILLTTTINPQLVQAEHMVDLDLNAQYKIWKGTHLIARMDVPNIAIYKDTLLVAGLRFGSKKTWLEIAGGTAYFPSIGMSDGAVTARFLSESWPIHFYGDLELLLQTGKPFWTLRSDVNLLSGKKSGLKAGIILEETKRVRHPFGIGPYTEFQMSGRYDELLFRFSYQWTAGAEDHFFRFATIFNFDFSWPRYRLFDVWLSW